MTILILLCFGWVLVCYIGEMFGGLVAWLRQLALRMH